MTTRLSSDAASLSPAVLSDAQGDDVRPHDMRLVHAPLPHGVTCVLVGDVLVVSDQQRATDASVASVALDGAAALLERQLVSAVDPDAA